MSTERVSYRDPWIPNENFSLPWVPDDVYVSIFGKLNEAKDVLSCRQINQNCQRVSDQMPTIQLIWKKLFCSRFWSEPPPTALDCRQAFQNRYLFHKKLLNTSYVTTQKWVESIEGNGMTTCMYLNKERIYSIKDEQKLLQIWNPSTGKVLKEIEEVKKSDPANKSVNYLLLFNDKIALGQNDGTVTVRNAENGELIKNFQAEEPVVKIDYENDMLLVYGQTKITFYDTSNGSYDQLFDIPFPNRSCVAMHGKLYCVVHDDAQVQITTLCSNPTSKFIDIDQFECSSFHITFLYIANENIFVAIKQVCSKSKILIFDAHNYTLKKTLKGTSAKINKLCIQNNKIISYSNECIKVWDETYECINTLNMDYRVCSRIFCDNILLYKAYNEIHVLDLTTGKSNTIQTASTDKILQFLVCDDKIIVLREFAGIETWDIWASPVEIYQSIADLFACCGGGHEEYERARLNFSKQPEDEIKKAIYSEFGALANTDNGHTARNQFLFSTFNGLYDRLGASKIRAQAIRNALLEKPKKSSEKKRNCIIS